MIKAFVLARVCPTKEFQTLSTVQSIDGVKEAHIIHGKHDLIAKIVANDGQHLKELIQETIRTAPNITSTCTLLVLDHTQLQQTS